VSTYLHLREHILFYHKLVGQRSNGGRCLLCHSKQKNKKQGWGRRPTCVGICFTRRGWGRRPTCRVLTRDGAAARPVLHFFVFSQGMGPPPDLESVFTGMGPPPDLCCICFLSRDGAAARPGEMLRVFYLPIQWGGESLWILSTHLPPPFGYSGSYDLNHSSVSLFTFFY
jgi:hypothetical protein